MPRQPLLHTKKHTTPDIITECYERSLSLLRKNAGTDGVIAAARSQKAVDRNYASIFGRDAAICSLGMVASGDRALVRLGRSLRWPVMWLRFTMSTLP